MKRLSCGFLTALVLCAFFLTGTAFASFPDVPAESPCAPAVAEMEARGRFNPTGSLSRGAACILFQNTRKASEAAGAPAPVFSPLPVPSPVPVTSPVPADGAARGGVSENGWLQVIGTQLCNEAGKPVVLRGMSSHGIQWYGQYAGSQSIANTARQGANLFRIAIYTEEGGYLSHPDAVFRQAAGAVDAAVANDLYVIVDWHILSDGTPITHLEEARTFFAAMAERYRDCPAVLYEICTEPNGAAAWERDVKPYAEQVIPVIRERSLRAVILVGGSTWSQDIHLAAWSPL